MPPKGRSAFVFLFFIINDFRRPAIRAGIAPPLPATTTRTPPPLPDYSAKAAEQAGKREADHGVYTGNFID
jgi:hypothetical protein